LKGNDNIFFSLSRLKYIGQNAIIGKTVRIRYPELVSIGENSIIDDFTYISTSLELTANVHIAAGCKLIGGQKAHISIGEYSTLAPNVTLAAGSDDYIGGIATPLVNIKYKGDVQLGNISIGHHCIVGAHSVVLPDAILNDGAAVGALSLVKTELDAWCLYAGIPAKKIKKRNRDKIEALEMELRKK
jgi:acetyltransferase-like isoleucine patch superfamily enzyme